MNLNAVASCLIKNGKSKQPNREFKRNVDLQLKMEWNSLSADQDLYNDFLTNEVMVAVKTIKFGKALGSDNLHPEFFYTLISELWMVTGTVIKLPIHIKASKVYKMEKLTAALKSNKPADNPRSYRPISLVCIPYKLYERFIYNQIKPVFESVGIIRQKVKTWCCAFRSFSCI